MEYLGVFKDKINEWETLEDKYLFHKCEDIIYDKPIEECIRITLELENKSNRTYKENNYLRDCLRVDENFNIDNLIFNNTILFNNKSFRIIMGDYCNDIDKYRCDVMFEFKSRNGVTITDIVNGAISAHSYFVNENYNSDHIFLESIYHTYYKDNLYFKFCMGS